jgi:hypothetical protein
MGPKVSQRFTTRAVVIASAEGLLRDFESREGTLKISVFRREGTHCCGCVAALDACALAA